MFPGPVDKGVAQERTLAQEMTFLRPTAEEAAQQMTFPMPAIEGVWQQMALLVPVALAAEKATQ